MVQKKNILILLLVSVGLLASVVSAVNIIKAFPKKNFSGGNNSNNRTIVNSTGKIRHTPKPSPLQSVEDKSNIENKDNEEIIEEKPDKNIPQLKDVKVKAVYITGSSAGNKKFLDNIINLINATELNSVVINIKEDGRVNYKSEIEEVKKIGAFHELYDLDDVIKKLHENNIYVIGRLVCFRDNYLATKRADLAIKRYDGTLWREGKIAWTNPYNRDVWSYNIDIAREAVAKGFDEIQFDYVRFPTARKNEVDYGNNPPQKADAISEFLEVAGAELSKMGAAVSADIFAIICESPGDREGIGQVLESVGMNIDCISPMIYPSHYANNSKGMMGNGVGQIINGILFKKPDLKPYDVVYNALLKTKERISKVEGYKAKVRPYLQDFTANYLPAGYYQVYGPEQVREQIKAVYDAGFEEWILWDPANTYSESEFISEQ